MAFDLRITRPGDASVSVTDYAYVASWDGVWQGAPWRGQDLVVPGRRGQVYAPQEYDAYTFSVPLMLLGTSQADFQDRLGNLRALIQSSLSSVVVSRVLPRTAGDLTTSCRARCRLSEMGAVNGLLNGRVALEVTNLDGCWYGASASTAVPTASTPVIVAGDAVTRRITLALPGAGTLTNGATGAEVTVTAAATLDVEEKTTTGALGDVAAQGDPFGAWFNLAPGTNICFWSGTGSATVTRTAAYA